MKLTKQQRETRQIEMVETYNIALSLRRLNPQSYASSVPVRRALYHALSMSGTSNATLEKVRIALELP